MDKQCTIDLQDYRIPGSRVLAGRERGFEAREASKIDTLAKECETVTIIIPDDMGAVTPSFLEPFLYNAVLHLRPENFFRKFKFQNNGRYKIDDDLFEAVDRIVSQESSLAPY